jgi:hypothetical protein
MKTHFTEAVYHVGNVKHLFHRNEEMIFIMELFDLIKSKFQNDVICFVKYMFVYNCHHYL